jgi:hypothetical protein
LQGIAERLDIEQEAIISRMSVAVRTAALMGILKREGDVEALRHRKSALCPEVAPTITMRRDKANAAVNDSRAADQVQTGGIAEIAIMNLRLRRGGEGQQDDTQKQWLTIHGVSSF